MRAAIASIVEISIDFMSGDSLSRDERVARRGGRLSGPRGRRSRRGPRVLLVGRRRREVGEPACRRDRRRLRAGRSSTFGVPGCIDEPTTSSGGSARHTSSARRRYPRRSSGSRASRRGWRFDALQAGAATTLGTPAGDARRLRAGARAVRVRSRLLRVRGDGGQRRGQRRCTGRGSSSVPATSIGMGGAPPVELR